MKRKNILMLLCLLFLCLALYSGYQLFLAWQEYAVSEKVYDELSQFVQFETTLPKTTEPTTVPTDPEDPTETAAAPATTEPEETAMPTEPVATEADDILWPVVDFESLQAINPDVVGWIYIPGTDINYPVVRGDDNDEYIYRLFDGTYNKAGSIFMDYRNNSAFFDKNTVLYGHHMRNGTMFAQLTEYADQAFYEAHPYGMLVTPNGNYLVEFFSGYVTNLEATAWKMRFSSDSDYSVWLDGIARKSYFTTDVIPLQSEQVLTLSTCTYDYDNARFVLHGVLRPVGAVTD